MRQSGSVQQQRQLLWGWGSLEGAVLEEVGVGRLQRNPESEEKVRAGMEEVTLGG